MTTSCWHCDGSGIQMRYLYPVDPPWLCPVCKGESAWRSRGHRWDDGCDPEHQRVLVPCAACGKPDISWRHECIFLDHEQGCPNERHHVFMTDKGVFVSTLDGCREHAIPKAEVDDRWRRAEDRDLEKVATCSVCVCCLGPCRIGYELCRGCGEGVV